MESIPFRLDTGATWLNLLATRGSAFGRHPEERIPTPERFADWLEAVELAPGAPGDTAWRSAITAEDRDLAVSLREVLRLLALAAAGAASGAGDEPTEGPEPTELIQPIASAARDLIAFLAAHEDPLRLEATSDGLTRTPPPTATAALARVARQAADHLTGPERHTLKSCPESDCRGVFTDPDDRRRWCPNPACATRGRVRAHRARKAADAS